MSGTNKETNEGKKRTANEAKLVEAEEVALPAVVKESEVIEEAEIKAEAEAVKSGERKEYSTQTEQCKISLQNILTMLQNETETYDFWKKLSSLVDKLVESEYRTLAAFACEKRGSSSVAGETLSTLFTKVLEAFARFFEQKQQALQSKSDELTALIGDESIEHERAINKQKDEINRQIIEINKQIIKINGHDKSANSKFTSIKEGTYFLCLGDVWHAMATGFVDSFDKSCFNRKCDIIVLNENTSSNDSNTASGKSENDWYTRYQTTRNGAVVPTNNVAEESSRSRDSSAKSANNFKVPVDIFGNEADVSTQSAHLLPHSKNCASTWFPVVPWVLNFSEDIEKLTWSVRQKCIHGYIVNNEGGNPLIDDSDSEKKANDKAERKFNKVGIKHFPTNRVLLKNQASYFDLYPCLLIVPLLEADKVTRWNGSGYSAIVLAANYKTPDDKLISGSKVYNEVVAGLGCSDDSFLATIADVNTARHLLENILRCLKATLEEFYQNDILISEKAKDALKTTKFFSKVKCEDHSVDRILLEMKEMKFPVAREELNKVEGSEDYVNIRKISFSSRISDAHNSRTNLLLHPAPDPVLLLLKSASNWLKLHSLPLLAGCMSQVMLEQTDPISFEEECQIRGWNIEEKYPTDICCEEKSSSTDDDVSLTDESDF